MIIKIRAKIEELKKQKQLFIAQVNSCNGAIETLEELLKDTEEGGKADGS